MQIKMITDYRLSYSQLLADLHTAYRAARRHKRGKPYQMRFEAHAEVNLEQLCRMLWTRTYRPQPSCCFVITEPKRREVFAAQFRDRIIHHLYFNYTHEMLERTFIADTYSCICQRGTHYGIRRLERHIRRESKNYTVPCYVLKMDITGYFMHIDRQRLLDITMRRLNTMAGHRISKYATETWRQRVDMDFVAYLTRLIIMLNPIENCCYRGSLFDWYGLPGDKSLMNSPEGCGMPIGNLTSQLFSNVYLNEFDQWMKRQMHCHHYGRYVDDFYVVSADRQWLLGQRRPIAEFLDRELGLAVNEEKTQICNVMHGVEFLGAFLKPRRRYVSNASLARIRSKVPQIEHIDDAGQMRSRLNSFLGILSHYKTYRIRRELYFNLPQVYRFGYFLKGMTKFVLYPGYRGK